jgi:hypothetical protein
MQEEEPQRHEPLTQVGPVISVQVAPQEPQLDGSVFRSTQDEPQHDVPPVQGGSHSDSMHSPPMHTNPAPHTLPQEPQFALSLSVSTHTPAQHSSPLPQGGSQGASTQVPVWQISPYPQAFSQVPQWAALVCVSVQPVEQQLSGGVQVVAELQAQVPTMHSFPYGSHSMPQPPQLWMSDRTSMHCPSQHVHGMSHVPSGLHGKSVSPAMSASSQSGHSTSMNTSWTLPSGEQPERMKMSTGTCQKAPGSVDIPALVVFTRVTLFVKSRPHCIIID